MRRDMIRNLINDILRIEKWSQENLAHAVGVKQPAVNRWIHGKSTPRSRHLAKLREIHTRAGTHHWASEQFFPVCAISESYPDDLPALVTQALTEVLDTELSSPPLKQRSDSFSIDIHIRPAPLPKGTSAYIFVNDRSDPTVFVLLVQKRLSRVEQRRTAWAEFYPHVAKYPFKDYAGNEGSRVRAGKLSNHPLTVAESVILHYPPKRNSHDEE